MADYEEIRYEVDDPVATITLSRPEAMNAWTPLMGLEVKHAVHRAAADPAVVGIVLTGEGRAFCAGADLGNLQSIASSQDGGESFDAGADRGGPHCHGAAPPQPQ